MKIIGVDVSKASIVACPLQGMPDNPRQFFLEAEFFKLKANKEGIKKLTELKPDIAILEPTGVNYSRIWHIHLEKMGCEVRMADHAKLSYYRRHLRLADKTDHADALALACYGWQYLNDKSRFNYPLPGIIIELRSHILLLRHLNRCQSPLENFIKQMLASQFPEVSTTKSYVRKDKPAPLWMFLAEEEQVKRCENKLRESIGTGIQQNVRLHAKRLCDYQRQEISLENQIREILERPEFAPYHKALEPFHFGLRTKATLISYIYPFKRFLGEDGKPISEVSRGRYSGKLNKKRISRRRFHKYLGVAPTEKSSGDRKSKRVSGGISICRHVLWLYTFNRIERKSARPDTKICQDLGEFLDKKKASGVSSKKVKSIISSKIVRIIYSRLVKELV